MTLFGALVAQPCVLKIQHLPSDHNILAMGKELKAACQSQQKGFHLGARLLALPNQKPRMQVSHLFRLLQELHAHVL